MRISDWSSDVCSSDLNLHLEPVYKIGRVVEANASTGADATARDSDTQMRFSRARPTDEHDIALVGEESPGGEIADQRLVDRGVGELEVRDLLGERQLGDRHLILDRAGMLVGDQIGRAHV